MSFKRISITTVHHFKHATSIL